MLLLKNFMKSAPARKGLAFLNQLPRWVKRIKSSESLYKTHPPILVNSLPKSGTHLLLQAARALPDTNYYGSFITVTPTVSFRLRSQEDINAQINSIVPGEVLGAHLHYSRSTADALKKINALHLFIYRDPRDVVISEAHYLAEMNRWHRLHKKFKNISDKQKRIRLSIEGVGIPEYPPVGERFQAFLGWKNDNNCLALRYEDLVDPDRRSAELLRVIDNFIELGGEVRNRKSLLDDLIKAIDPKKSHTFHKGGTERWRKEMNAENQALMLEQFPDLSP